MRLIDFPNASWGLQYLADDGSPLPDDADHLKGRGRLKWELEWIACTKDIWDEAHTLNAGFNGPEWISLLLDAKNQLPEVGPAIVLAVTALEVLASRVLEDMAAKSETVPAFLWSWINDRGIWFKEPDSKEQYDVLLRLLIGTSLKENNILWEAFCNLRDARNSFVHEGVARIGKKKEVTVEDAKEMIGRANEIVAFVKERLPADLQWPEFNHTFEITLKKEVAPKPELGK